MLAAPLASPLSSALAGIDFVIYLAAARAGNLTWANFESELVTSATAEGHNDNETEFNLFTDYIFFNAAAFNHADNDALDTALTNETMTLALLDTYAAAYTP